MLRANGVEMGDEEDLRSFVVLFNRNYYYCEQSELFYMVRSMHPCLYKYIYNIYIIYIYINIYIYIYILYIC